MTTRIGTGPDSWGVWFADAPNQVPWKRYLDEVVEAGYEWTELGPYGFLPTDVTVLQTELDRRGLRVVASTVMAGHLERPSDWPKVEEQVLRVGELGAALGARYLVLIDDTYFDLATGEQVAPERLDENAWSRLIEATHRVADISRDRFDLPLAFHPHAESHVQYEDQIEAFLEQTDRDRVSLLLDTGHHAYCGGDPVSFIRNHHDRISYLHLKSVDGDVMKRVRLEEMPILEATKIGVFCEPAIGTIDFEELAKVLHKIGYDGWATVEQDIYQPPLDVPLPIAKRTREYLRQVGIG